MITMLLLLLTVIAIFILILAAAVLFLFRRRTLALRVSKLAGLVALTYGTLLLTAALIAPRYELQFHQPKCFDDWCVVVTGAERTSALTAISFRVENRARRVAMRPSDPAIALLDNEGRPLPMIAESGPPLNSYLEHGDSFQKIVRYAVTGRLPARFVITEGGWPTRFVIGDDNSFFHPKPYVVIR